MKKRIIAIARKEFLHIIHDIRSLVIIFVMPVIMLVLFGYALNLEIQDVNLAVFDLNKTPVSRNLVDEFVASKYFTVSYQPDDPSSVNTLFLSRQARAALIISKDFSRALKNTHQAPVQLLVDAADPNAASFIKIYCNGVISRFNEKNNADLPLPFDIKPRIWFNPDMKSAYFFVPGLIALILIMISALLTSITITREKELGTMEQILVSPVRPNEIIIGKVLPYILLAFLDGLTILLLGVFIFDVPFQGSYVLLTFLSLIFLMTALSFGLMISTIVSTQQVAMMLSLSATLLPTVMLSGFIFPINSMPVILQYLSYLVPAKYYIMIIRGIMMKGNTLEQLLVPALFLVVLTAVMLRNALHRFNLTLEK